jgi:hypothetical protein
VAGEALGEDPSDMVGGGGVGFEALQPAAPSGMCGVGMWAGVGQAVAVGWAARRIRCSPIGLGSRLCTGLGCRLGFGLGALGRADRAGLGFRFGSMCGLDPRLDGAGLVGT